MKRIHINGDIYEGKLNENNELIEGTIEYSNSGKVKRKYKEGDIFDERIYI